MEISDGGIALLTWGSLAIASVLWWGGTFAFPKIMVPVNILAYGIMIGGLWKVSGSNPQNETEGD
jgi:hypothetical protein